MGQPVPLALCPGDQVSGGQDTGGDQQLEGTLPKYVLLIKSTSTSVLSDSWQRKVTALAARVDDRPNENASLHTTFSLL